MTSDSPTVSSEDMSVLGIECKLSEIPVQLSHLWQDQARTRASMMNFAIYEEREEALVPNSELLAEITSEHACRGILIAAPQGDLSEPEIRAWVTAHCQLRGGEKSVCSEQLAFLIKSPRASLVTSTVFANLDSDLPLVLWWRGDLSEQFEERFYSVVDRLIIDSATWSDPLTQFEMLQEAERELNSRFIVNDLAWSRSYHQRVALASLFQNPRLSNVAESIQKITIGYKSDNVIPAFMLGAWIAFRLGLKRVATEGNTISLVSEEGVPVKLCFEDSGVCGLTAIRSLNLEGADWNLSLTRRSDSRFIHSKVELLDTVSESFFPADVRSEAALVSRILSRRGQNRLYFQMIPFLKEFLTRDGC